MKEEQLFEPMISYLKNNGYVILEEHHGNEHGVDIIAEKEGKRLYVELKGDSKSTYVDFGTMIYQIMKQVKPDSTAEYALGVSKAHEKYALSCKFPFEKLKIKVFIITNSEVVNLF